MRPWKSGVVASIGVIVCLSLLSATAHASVSPTPQCTDPYSSGTVAGNPLLLPSPPGANPLNGANLFVNGPAHGAAAGAIAQMLGKSPKSFPETESWSTFAGMIAGQAGSYSQLPRSVQELAKIAVEPEVQRVSAYSEGGTAAGIYSQTQKLYCHNFRADPGSVPIISTYFLHAALGGCPSASAMRAAQPLFEARVNAVAAATGNRPVVFLLETDGIGSSACMQKIGDLGSWFKLIHYEVSTLGSLPHAVTYVEAGYSDGNSPRYTAAALKQVGISQIRGFFTNDTHSNWTIDEVTWGEQIDKLLGNKPHFIVNTATNGNGPLIPKNRGKFGNEDLCNPPNRALGPRPTTATGFPLVDAFLWTSPPGNSSGPCNGGPSSGTFWPARAVQLATDANGRLGPKGPSAPY